MGSNQPLGMPAGSVRSLITVIIVGTVCAMCVLGKPIPEILSQGFLLSIGMYHLIRQGGKMIAIPDDSEATP